MSQFLEKLFNYEYFGVILLCVIAVLAVLFIVVFAIAIKDSKKIKKKKELTILDDEYGNEKHDEENIAFKEESKEEAIEIPLDDILGDSDNKDLDVTLTDLESEIKLMDNDMESITDDSELQTIAMSFAKEYKKGRDKVKEEPEEIKEEKEEVKHIELPNFNDIPAPQPVKVVDEQPIIDSSKPKKKHRSSNPLDDIIGEEYNLK